MRGFFLLVAVFSAAFAGQIGDWKQFENFPKGYEPSAVVHLTGQNLLAVGSDTSQLCYVPFPVQNGSVVCEKLKTKKGRPDILFIGQEIPPKVYEYNWKTKTMLRTFDFEPWFPTKENKGMEGLTWVIDPTYRNGGYFAAVSQLDGDVYEFAVDPVTDGVTFLRNWRPPVGKDVTDVADAFYAPWNLQMFVLSDAADKIWSFDVHTGKNPIEWSLDDNFATHQEGLWIFPPTVSPATSATLIIGDDSGSLWSATIHGLFA